jgi:hypothetical protein
MVIATRSMDAKGALEHILTVILVYDSNVKEALEGLGATDVHDFMDLGESDFKLPFDCRDKNDPSSIVKDVTLPPLTIKKLISLQQWFATQPGVLSRTLLV